jgi:lipid-A-disaccharide synthase
MALQLGKKLAYPTYSYKFVPAWNKRLRKLYVHDETAFNKARRLAVPEAKLELIGNLIADAVEQVAPPQAMGSPHILLMAGTRDGFSLFLIPFIIALADYLLASFPEASFVWPVSRLISEETIKQGIAGREKAILSGMAGVRKGNLISTPSGAVITMIEEHERHAHMRAANLAITIPGTNTLELGIAGLPSIVILPMNKPEAIPLDGIGHWLGLIPLLGKYLKRYAVKAFVEGLDVPVSLPNRHTHEDLMLELKGKITAQQVAKEAECLLKQPDLLAQKRARLLATMPKAGAAKRLVASITQDLKEVSDLGN